MQHVKLISKQKSKTSRVKAANKSRQKKAPTRSNTTAKSKTRQTGKKRSKRKNMSRDRSSRKQGGKKSYRGAQPHTSAKRRDRIKKKGPTKSLPLLKFKAPPRKSSFQKRSRNVNVIWSPQVKHVERPNDGTSTNKTRKSNIFLKIDHSKTQQMKGTLYASYADRTSPIVVFALYDDGRSVIRLHVDIAKKQIISVATPASTITFKEGKQRIRLLLQFGDIVWKHDDVHIPRKCTARGFNVAWLQSMQECRGRAT